MVRILYSFFAFLMLAPSYGTAVQYNAKLVIHHEEFISQDIDRFDCHSSSLAAFPGGALCAVWKGGSGDGLSNIDMQENVDIWCSFFDGEAWSEPAVIVPAPGSVCWNPVLSLHPSGELMLFYRLGKDPRRSVSFLKRSFNCGKTWSQEEILPAGIVGPTKNKPFITESGTLICPSSSAAGDPRDLFKSTACWIEITHDMGKHWEKKGPFTLEERSFGVVEPAIICDSRGRLRMYCRDRANKIGLQGYIWEAISEDEGKHWSAFRKTCLPNPDSAFDIAYCRNDMHVLCYNHSHTDRFPLNCAFSLDGGESWSMPFILDGKGEFPALIATDNGLIHATYAIPGEDSEQRRIKHVIFSLEAAP